MLLQALFQTGGFPLFFAGACMAQSSKLFELLELFQELHINTGRLRG